MTYQCDLQMPRGWFNGLVERSLVPLNEAAARLADAIVVTSADYAAHSAFLRRHAAKLQVIPTLIDVAAATESGRRRLRERAQLDDAVCIGFAARFAAEKGVEYLLAALPRVAEAIPNLRALFTGAYQYTVGEEAYAQRLAPLLEAQRERLVFFDLLSDDDMANFFSLCDVLAVTSLNSTESFGLVQVEAMLCGTPVVATDIPGVREAVRRTGMGRIVPPHDADALADALIDVIRNRARFQRPRAAVAAAFDLDAALAQYEALFQRCVAG
jgi:glycosyltransferase involved in cell wall biosynthesis